MSAVSPAPLSSRNDSETFAQFFEREYPRLVRALVPVTRSLPTAEEIGQEAMSKVFERWSRASGFESPIGYAYTIGVNLHRRRQRTRWVPFLSEDSASDPSLDPAATIVERDRLLRALQSLSATERDTLLMVSYLGLTVAEVAGVTGLKAASIRSRLHRARQSLRDALKEDQEHER